MSIFQNKQVIHIIGEVIVLSSVVIYFHFKTKKLNDHILEIVKKLQEQDEIIQKHDILLKQLVTKNVQHFQNIPPRFETDKSPEVQTNVEMKPQAQVHFQVQSKTKKQAPKVETKPVVLNLDTTINEVNEEVIDETDEEELDNEIARELEELDEEDEAPHVVEVEEDK